jgi:hypothetical protein
MAQFIADRGPNHLNPGAAARLETERRQIVESNFDQFLDPGMDMHSSFYTAMELDKHAAHIVAGTAFVDLNNVVLRTECNNSYESMNEDDMRNLRKLMWDVYIPHMKETLKIKMSVNGDDESTTSFQAQMYVVHLSIRVAQALQLVFELNQKKTFSAVAKAAYEMALQDILYHPNLNGRVQPFIFKNLINYMRRHPTYAATFNTYVGYKLLRQQLSRGGGAGTNRKSNDAERLHDEAANRLWDVLDENSGVYNDFMDKGQWNEPYKMEWHSLYYKEVAQTLYSKLAKYGEEHEPIHAYPDRNEQRNREVFAGQLNAAAGVPPVAAAAGPAVAAAVGQPYVDQQHLGNRVAAEAVIDIVDAIHESRATVSAGTTKRLRLDSRLTESGPQASDVTPVAVSTVSSVRSAYTAWFT